MIETAVPGNSPFDLASSCYKKELSPHSARNLVYARERYICNIVAGHTTLDVGCVGERNMCSSDWLHGHLSKCTSDLDGIDIDSKGLEEMRQAGWKNIYEGTIESYNTTKKYDRIVMGEILEHVQNAGTALLSANKLLSDTGLLIITVPNANSLMYFLQNLIFKYEVDGYDHRAFYTALTLRNILKDAKLKIVQLRYLHRATHKNHAEWWLRLIVGAFYWLQTPFLRLFPQLAKGLIVVASKQD